MFEEAQLYSPVSHHDDGTVEVHLGKDHPGFHDAHYRARRNAIAARAVAWRPVSRCRGSTTPTARPRSGGRSVPSWPRSTAVAPIPEYLAAKQRLALPTDRIPQLDEVSATLRGLTGFRYVAAPGLVELREFYSSLGDRVFHSTQYVRHPSQPLYTPEPDVIHEVLGHGNQLASPRFAAVTRAAGAAVARAERDETVQVIADVFWFTMEFGVMYDGPELKAYGAGICSSYGEIDEFRGDGDQATRADGDGHPELRHHDLPARPVRRTVGRPPRGRGRQLLRPLRRRGARADRRRPGSVRPSVRGPAEQRGRAG